MAMMNDLSVYAESGRKAGIAANHDDWALVSFERNWLTRALALESIKDAAMARNMWSLQYAAARGKGSK